jgi:hypothetical protein
MSLLDIQGALLTRLGLMASPLPTSFENDQYTPTMGAPWQRVTLMPAAPGNDEMSASYREQGVLQVDLFYPLNTNAGAAKARAAALRDWFPRKLSLTQAGVVTSIDRTPEIGPGYVADAWFCVPVRIRFFAAVTV